MPGSLNWKQVLCLGVGMLASLYVLQVPPWRIGGTSLPYPPHWPFGSPYVYWMFPLPSDGDMRLEVDWPRLCLFLGGILVVTGTAVLAFRTRDRAT